MDGFHLDNRILDARGLRPRKGAPETFDAVGFAHMIRRLTVEPEVILPIFDRSRDIAIAGAQVVGPATSIAVVEGIYLLLDAAPWTALHPLWDLSVFLDVDEAELERRLVQRWLDYGHTPDQARARAQANDLPNARRIIAESRAADITL
jgi:fructokinase